MRMMDPNSPTARAKARPAPASTEGSTLGRMTRNSTCRRVAPSDAAASSTSASSSASTGWTLRTQKGRVTKSSATATPTPGARQVDVQRAVDAVEREQREAGHHGRQREGQVDHGAHERLAAEVVPHQHAGDGQAGDGVDHRHNGGEGQRELERGHGQRVGHGGPERAPAAAEGLGDDRGQRAAAPAATGR